MGPCAAFSGSEASRIKIMIQYTQVMDNVLRTTFSKREEMHAGPHGYGMATPWAKPRSRDNLILALSRQERLCALDAECERAKLLHHDPPGAQPLQQQGLPCHVRQRLPLPVRH